MFRAVRADGTTHSVGLAGTPDSPLLYVDGSACLPPAQPPTLNGADAWANRLGIYTGEVDTFRLRCAGGSLLIYSDDDRYEVPALPLDEYHLASDFGLFAYVDGEPPQLVGGGGLWRFTRQADAP